MFSDLLDIPGELRVNWFEVALSNSRGLRQSINVPFTPEHIFIYNPTDANLYMSIGADRVPDISNADLTCLAQAYYLFDPTGVNTDQFGVMLDSPTVDFPCNIIFAAGESQQDRDKLRQRWDFDLWVRAGNLRLLYYPPFPALYCRQADFLVADDNWTAFAACNYVPGSGFVSPGGSPQIDLLPGIPIQVNEFTIEYDLLGAGFINWTIYLQIYNGGVLQNPPLGTIIGGVGGADPAGSYSKTLVFVTPVAQRTGDELRLLFLSGGGVGKSITMTGFSMDYFGLAYLPGNCP